MNKKILFLLTTMIGFASLFTACSDDDDKIKNEYLELEGDYFASSSEKESVLQLTYGGGMMLGGQTSFKAVGGDNAIIALGGIIPGEPSVELNNVVLKKKTGSSGVYSFEGKQTTSTGEVTYNGTIESGKMALQLGFEMAKKDLVGKWNLVQPGATESPIHMVWESDVEEIKASAKFLEQIIPSFITPEIVKVLKSIELRTDGNVIAEYSDAGAETVLFKPSTPNLAHYYVKDNLLYALLNIEMIIAEVGKTRAESEPDLLGLLLELVANGIPVKYTASSADKSLTLFIDLAMIEAIMDKLTQSGMKDDLLEVAKELIIEQLLDVGMDEETAIDFIEQIVIVWNNTSKFEIGLNLKAS